MCIDCILNDDHKSHSLLNVESAYQQCIDECNSNIKKIADKKHSLHDNKIIISMTLEKLNKDKESVLKEANNLFEELLSMLKARQRQVTDSLNKDFEFLINENEKRLSQLSEAIISVDTISSISQSLKAYSNVEFLKWHTSKHNPVTRMLQLCHKFDYNIPNEKIVFTKDQELALISKMIYNKKPFDLLKDKNKSSPINSVSTNIGKNYKAQNKAVMNKCYSVSALNDTKTASITQSSVFENRCNGTTLPGTPSKKDYKTNLVDHRTKTSKISNKGYETNVSTRTKLIPATETKLPKREGKGVLSFLRKNSKIKTSKLKCAARTQIDLKSLNYNTEEVGSNYFTDAFESTKSPVNNTRFETAYENYVTEPRTSRDEIILYTHKEKSNSLQRLKYTTSAHSSSPARIFNRAININEIKKTNPELIRKSLQNFERSFKDILGDRSPKFLETEP